MIPALYLLIFQPPNSGRLAPGGSYALEVRGKARTYRAILMYGSPATFFTTPGAPADDLEIAGGASAWTCATTARSPCPPAEPGTTS